MTAPPMALAERVIGAVPYELPARTWSQVMMRVPFCMRKKKFLESDPDELLAEMVQLKSPSLFGAPVISPVEVLRVSPLSDKTDPTEKEVGPRVVWTW